MRPHIHVGVATGIAVFATVLIAGSLWRIGAYRMLERNPDSSLGKAMLAAY